MEPSESSTSESVMPPAEPAVDDGVERRLDPATIQVDRLGGLVTTVVVGGGALLSAGIGALAGERGAALVAHGMGAIALASVLALWAWHWPRRRWEHASYRVDPRGIRVCDGVWWRTETDVPRSRIQHTDVTQGPIERLYDIATLVIHTAGTEHSQVVVQGLSKSVAFRIRDNLLHVGSGDAV